MTMDPHVAGLVRQLLEARETAATDEELAALAGRLRDLTSSMRLASWESYVWQRPHRHPDGWVSLRDPGVCDERCALLPTAVLGVGDSWLQRGGRGTGKTEGAAHYINEHVMGPPCDTRAAGGHRLSIVAPTQADAVSSCVEGISGLKAINPRIVVTTNREGTTARWPNGAIAKLVGANTAKDIDRLRAWTNICCAWVEEAAAMPQLGGLSEHGGDIGVMDQLAFTLRLGSRPHKVITTTPQNRPEVVALIDDPRKVETWGRTEDAHNLDPAVRAVLEEKFRGTTLGDQELDGKLIKDTPGALWVQQRPDVVDGAPNTDDRPGIDNGRVGVHEVTWISHRTDAPVPTTGWPCERVIVAVDPPGGRTECGIIVVGAIGLHAYVLADLSTAAGPDVWANSSLGAHYDYGSIGVAAEHTYGGNMVTDVFSTRDASVPIFRVPTKVGKRLRAEPVQALYQQGRVHHVGRLDGLETEMRTWVPGKTTESPNRIDALVHAITWLLIRRGGSATQNPNDGGTRLPGR